MRCRMGTAGRRRAADRSGAPRPAAAAAHRIT
jgi:hypothetical protein